MRFYTTQHPFYCGIDLHARAMYVCILDHSGDIVLPRNLKTNPETFLKVIAPYRDGLVVAVACMFTWYWLADLCADQGLPSLIGYDDELLRDVELAMVKTAQHHDANTLYLRQTVPGIGKILSLVRLYDIHDLNRFPRGQECASSCRLVTCAKVSAGKRSGTSGTKIGTAHLKWAFAEAAVWFLRDHPAGQKFLARLEKKHSKGNALTILAPKLARAAYYMLKRKTAFDMQRFFERLREGSR